jgi:hypothetical protein
MPSKRIRSKKSVAATLSSMNQVVTRVEHTSTPYSLADGAVVDGSIDLGSITGASFSEGSISSRALSLSAYTPNGEANQRVPAPLNNVEYWTDVIFGLNELHRSGIHNNEDIQNVAVTTAGISFTTTGVEGGDARIYLTGRLSVPKSMKVYATWESSAPIPIKAIYWDAAEKFLVDELEIIDGVVTAVTRDPHGYSIGNVVKITGCGPSYDSVATIISVDTNSFTYAAPASAPSNSAKIYLAIAGRVSIEVFNYISLQDRVSVDLPETAGEYAVYAELPYTITDTRVLRSAKVFEIIGSGSVPLVTANVSSKSITSNVATLTTSTDHNFYVGDAVKVSGIIDVATTSSYEVTAGGGSGSTPNTLTVVTTVAHGFTSGAPISISGSTIDGTYAISTVPTSTSFTVQTALSVIGSTSITETVTRSGSVFNGQALISDTTSNTFSFSRTVTGGSYPNTAVSPEGLADVGNPRYSYIDAIQASVLSSFIKIFTFESHGFSVGETIKISGISALDPLYEAIDGEYVVSASSTDTMIQFDLTIPPVLINYTVLPTQAAIAYTGSSDVKVESGPDGLRFISSGDGNSVSTDLGTSSDNFLGVTRLDGKSVASIDEFGVGTFSSLIATSITAEEIVVNDYDLVGDFAAAEYNDIEYTGSLLNRLARGLTYHGTFYVDSGYSVTRQFQTLAHGTFSVEAGRQYQITATTGGLRASPSINAIFELLMSTEPLAAEVTSNAPRHMGHLMAASVASSFAPLVGTYSTVASTRPAGFDISTLTRSSGNANVVVNTTTAHGLVVGDFAGISTANTTANVNGTVAVTAISPPNQFTYVSANTTAVSLFDGTVVKVDPLLSEVGKLPAGVPIRWLLRIRHGSAPTSYNITTDFSAPASTQQMELTVVDIGQAKTAVNVTKVGAGGLLDLTTTGSGGTGSGGTTTTTYTKTQTVNASDSAYYDNFGKGTGTSDPYAFRFSLYQGNPGTAGGTKKSAVLFPTFATLPAGATDVTVTKVEVYLRNRHSYNSGGLTAYIGVHSSSSLGASIPAITNVGVTTSSFTKGQGKWVTLPSGSHTAFRPTVSGGPTTQTARGIILGATDDDPDTYYSLLANYGYFDGNTMADEPKLRVTYTYKL